MQKDKGEGRAHNLKEFKQDCCLLCCSCKTKLQLPSGDSPPWYGCHCVPLLSLVPTAVVTQQMVKQLLTPHQATLTSGTLCTSLQLAVVQLNCFSDEPTDVPPIWDRN